VLEHYPVMRRTMETVAAERLNKIGQDPSVVTTRDSVEADINMVNEIIRQTTPRPSVSDSTDESDNEGRSHSRQRRGMGWGSSRRRKLKPMLSAGEGRDNSEGLFQRKLSAAIRKCRSSSNFQETATAKRQESGFM